MATPPPDPAARATVFVGEGAHRAVYVISVAAELAGVHPQTLRVYERKGLVDPSRTGGGNRRYSQRDIERLRHIGTLTGEGLNLEGVRRVLALEAEVQRLEGELERVRAEARDVVERTHRHYRRDLVPLRQALVVRRSADASATGTHPLAGQEVRPWPSIPTAGPSRPRRPSKRPPSWPAPRTTPRSPPTTCWPRCWASPTASPSPCWPRRAWSRRCSPTRCATAWPRWPRATAAPT